jgi:hypothetical protein
MAEPRRPYYVSFTIERIPTTVDHSQSNPGGAASGAERAGHTSVRLSPSGGPQLVPYTGSARADGMVPFYYRSINVRFTLSDFAVAISSDYAVGSCAYEATRRHEYEAHLYRPIRIFWLYRDTLIADLNRIVVPTEAAPQWVRPAEVAALRANLEQQINEAVYNAYQNLLSALRTARDIDDNAEHYRLVYRQCTPAEWASGR